MTWLLDRQAVEAAAARLGDLGQSLVLREPFEEARENLPAPFAAGWLSLERASGRPCVRPHTRTTPSDEAAAGEAPERPCLVVSHYVHIEALTPPAGTMQSVRVETAFGHNSLGVRPGRETRELVEVIAARDDLQWAGLAVSIRSAGMAEAAARQLEDLADLAAGELPPLLYETTQDDLATLLPPGSVRVTPIPVRGLQASVSSRPALERAELAVGRRQGVLAKQRRAVQAAGHDDEATATVRIIAAEADRCLVELPESLHDRLIGSTITLKVEEPIEIVSPCEWL